MVQLTMLFKKRQNTDIDNMDFVQDAAPIGVQPGTGLPIYREIDHSSFLPQPFTIQYKNVNNNDNYGLFTSFQIRPGPRKLRQTTQEIIIEQTSSKFLAPSYIMAMFGLRVGALNEETGVYTPLSDHYRLDRNQSMLCDNTADDLRIEGVNNVVTELNNVLACPLAIDLVSGGTFKKYPLSDAAYMTPLRHTSTVSVGSKTYTTHDISQPIYNHLPDSGSLPAGLVLDVKLQVYVLYTEHVDSSVSDGSTVLRMFEADNIISFSSVVDVI